MNNRLDSDSSTGTVTFSEHSFYINYSQIDKIAYAVQAQLGVEAFDLSLSFVSPTEIQQLNESYRHQNRSTDVLSFPQTEWPEPVCVGARAALKPPENQALLLGDLVISPVNAWQNAQEIGQGLDREIAFLLVHGILHLCGHDHQNPEEETLMKQQQQLLIKALESHDDPLWQNCVRLT